MDTEQFVKHINSLRRSNKNQWYTFSGTVNGKSVSLKAFGTWIQVIVVDGVRNGFPSDITVRQFNESLLEALRWAKCM